MENWIFGIKDVHPFNAFSQHNEDGIIRYILDNIGDGNKFYVDGGAGCYGGMVSNTKYLMVEHGWRGLRFDIDVTDDPDIIKAFIAPETIVDLLKQHNCPHEIDFLSLDIDSSDFWVADAILKEFSPRFMCLEFNPSLPPMSKLVLKYQPGYTWDSTNKYGFSFGAGKFLCEKYGYTIIFNQYDQNLFIVRNDLIAGLEVPEITARQKTDHPVNHEAEWVEAT